DPDSGENGLLRYSLERHGTNQFDIDENTGQIFTVSVRGWAGTIYLKVQATDQGGRGLTAQATVNVTIDASSSNNIVVLVLNQMINAVEKNIAEIKRVLEEILAWNIYIIDCYSTEYERRARESTNVTYLKIIAVDEAGQEIPAEDVKRKLTQQKIIIQSELEKIFETPVTADLREVPADSMSPELTATIVLSILLGCTLVAFLVYIFFTIKRSKKQQWIVEKQSEIIEGFDNAAVADGNGSPKIIEKTEHMNN
ncbi:hypothetical protein N308_11900, partial [Struthio camelus australis]